jgi:hypothetical protein
MEQYLAPWPMFALQHPKNGSFSAAKLLTNDMNCFLAFFFGGCMYYGAGLVSLSRRRR